MKPERKTGKSDFFSNTLRPSKPIPQYIDRQKFQLEKTPEQVFTAVFDAAKRSEARASAAAADKASVKKALDDTHTIVEQMKTKLLEALKTYQSQQAAQAGFFSYFTSTPNYSPDINFITSIALTLNVQTTASPIYLDALKGDPIQTSHLLKDDNLRANKNKIVVSIASIIEGAHIYIREKTAASIRQALWFNDPAADPFYTELSKRISAKNNEEQACCLIALGDYLKNPAVQKAVNFGGKTAEAVLAEIERQVNMLQSSSPKPK